VNVMDDNKVAVLLEDLKAQFRTFGEGLQLVNDKIDKMDHRIERVEQKLDIHVEENRREFNLNRQEHQQLIQMIKELDREVQVEIKRVK
jgi:DNA anti-recombination protein RmuC